MENFVASFVIGDMRVRRLGAILGGETDKALKTENQ
jgi:hypothetical protein